jgi:hypothetical protein
MTLAAIAVLAALGVGFGAGWGLKPDAAVEAMKAQTAALTEVQKGNEALVARVNEVAVAEAARESQIAERLTGMPPQCVKELGGDPMSAGCAWAWCVRTGETSAQRCEAGKFTDLLVQQYAKQAACPEPKAP